MRKEFVWRTFRLGPEGRQDGMGTMALRGGGWGALPRAG